MENCSSMNYMTRSMPRYGNNGMERCQHPTECRYDTRDEFPIGMTYVPWQKWRDIYEPSKALERGTIFAELDKPFLGMRGVRK